MSTFKLDIPGGPIWNDEDAKEKAPRIAAAHQGKWNGQWTTTNPNEMSVVGVELQVENTGANHFITDVLAGPLWNDADAQKYGPAIAASYGAEFTGQWKTIKEGVMSVIGVKFTY
ncbi:MAG: mannan-binding lectin [Oceanihabitans sp.]|nr:mannan-binding lectin [Oceanihabitans sp.]